MGAYKFIKFHT